ncbi:MAG: site-2 protease family protein [Clostridia bacterium]|nr:site-2 protease family protein [Clostridia bacterium]
MINLPLQISSGFTYFLYIVLAIFIFGLLILIHECGHYIAARIFRVTIKEFSIGMGPKLLSYTSKKNNIAYSLRAFPIGGFVSMAGEDEDVEDPNALNKKKPWKRLIIMLAGPGMNILLGVLAMTILVSTPSFVIGGTTVALTETEDHPGYVQIQSDELLVGDKIIKVGKTRVHYLQELSYEIMNQGYEPTDLTVVRNGQKIVLKSVVFPVVEDSGTSFGDMFFKVDAIKKNVFTVLSYSLFSSFSTIKMIWDSLISLITGRIGLGSLSGPVGVTKAVADSARYGISNLVYVSIFITMNLGVFNLLPIPALDGSRIMFILIEMVRGKPINPKYEGYIHFAGIIILIALMIAVTLKDIISLIT